MEFRYNLLIPLHWDHFHHHKIMLLFLCVPGVGGLSCSQCPSSATVLFLPFRKQSCLYILSTSPLFPFALKHIPVQFTTQHSINTANCSCQQPMISFSDTKSNCPFSVFILLVLSAAFDIADHSLFLEALASFGHTLFSVYPTATPSKPLFLERPKAQFSLVLSYLRSLDDLIQSTQHFHLDLSYHKLKISKTDLLTFPSLSRVL